MEGQQKTHKEELKVDFQACNLDLFFVYIPLSDLKELSQLHLLVPETKKKRKKAVAKTEATQMQHIAKVT